MQKVDGKNLSDTVVLLSDLIGNTYDHVKLINLDGKELVIDVTLDGNYEYPNKPKEASWKGKKGREGVHTSLLSISDSKDFTVTVNSGCEVRNSRGRGFTVSDCSDFTLHDIYVRGARTAGISVQDCGKFTVYSPVTVDTGNYQDAKNEGKNWPGSIRFVDCSNYSVYDPISIDHMGNGITATESKNGTLMRPFAYSVNGANVYINASPDHTIQSGLTASGKYKSNGYVVNSEEENQGVSENCVMNYCVAVDTLFGLGFWGNEGKTGLTIDYAEFSNGLLIDTMGIKFHEDAGVRKFVSTDTFVVKSKDFSVNSGYNDVLSLIAACVETVLANESSKAIIDSKLAMHKAISNFYTSLISKTESPTKEEVQEWLKYGRDNNLLKYLFDYMDK